MISPQLYIDVHRQVPTLTSALSLLNNKVKVKVNTSNYLFHCIEQNQEFYSVITRTASESKMYLINNFKYSV